MILVLAIAIASSPIRALPEAHRAHRLDRTNLTPGQYCDLSRQYDPVPSPNTTTGLANGTVVPAWKGGDVITPLLNKYGKYDLLAYMNKYWKSQGAPGEWLFNLSWLLRLGDGRYADGQTGPSGSTVSYYSHDEGQSS